MCIYALTCCIIPAIFMHAIHVTCGMHVLRIQQFQYLSYCSKRVRWKREAVENVVANVLMYVLN